MVEDGQCSVAYVSTKEMLADALTKPLARELHERLTRSMGLLFSEDEKLICNLCRQTFPSRNVLHDHLRAQKHYCVLQNQTMSMMISDLEL